MGGAVSTGKDNDDLIDKLCDGMYIKSKLAESLFRNVDRGHYFLPDHQEQAYRDTAWRSGNIHMSAPCIYSDVIEALELKSGLSFLNLGSGTGYLSTMVSIALGPYGVNHGVELHPEVAAYAISRLTAFIIQSESWDEAGEICPPQFVVGNCLLCQARQKYDRIYCGAACPEPLIGRIKCLLKPAGILVVPVSDRLVQYRLSEDGTTWSQKDRMPVSFASLITPDPSLITSEDTENEHDPDNDAESNASSTFEPPQIGANTISPTVRDHIPVLPDHLPPSLQQICRFNIRRYFLQQILADNPELLTERRFFDREANKKAEKEWSDDASEVQDVTRTTLSNMDRRRRRRRPRYLSIGNNFGVIVISENATTDEDENDEEVSNEDESSTEEEEEEPQLENETVQQDEAEGPRRPANRPRMPHLLRLFLQTRRLTQERQLGFLQPETEPQSEEMSVPDEENPRRRRRISSNTSASAAPEEPKKQKEVEDNNSGSGGSTVDSPLEPPKPRSKESTGRRLSRILHRKVGALQLPSSLEAFIMYYRSAPPEPEQTLHEKTTVSSQ